MIYFTLLNLIFMTIIVILYVTLYCRLLKKDSRLQTQCLNLWVKSLTCCVPMELLFLKKVLSNFKNFQINGQTPRDSVSWQSNRQKIWSVVTKQVIISVTVLYRLHLYKPWRLESWSRKLQLLSINKMISERTSQSISVNNFKVLVFF